MSASFPSSCGRPTAPCSLLSVQRRLRVAEGALKESIYRGGAKWCLHRHRGRATSPEGPHPPGPFCWEDEGAESSKALRAAVLQEVASECPQEA